MKISVIIPCYNGASTIERAVTSIMAQTLLPFEIIIIDDGSNQETKNVLETLENDIPILRVITQANSGVSVARNVGVRYSHSEYILMLDADDIFHPTYLEKAVYVLDVDNSVAMVMCGYNIVNGNTILDTRFPIKASFEDYLFSNHGLGNGLFRKKAIVQVGGYDELMVEGYEDWELSLRLKKLGWNFHVLTDVLFDYFTTENSRNSKALAKDTSIRNYLFKKYKEDYIANYDQLIPYFQGRLDQIKNTIRKREQSIDFKIGQAILVPLRWLKKVLK